MNGSVGICQGADHLPCANFTPAGVEPMIVAVGRHDERIKMLEEALARIEDKLDSQTKWLMGAMGSALISMLVLVMQLLLAKK
jgi:hypothetical protein